LQLQSLCDNWFSLPEQNWLKLNERYSRRGFPRDLAHLNPVPSNSPANFCIWRNGTQSLYDVGGIVKVLCVFGEWLSDASSGNLEYDGWEPVPRAGRHLLGMNIGDFQRFVADQKDGKSGHISGSNGKGYVSTKTEIDSVMLSIDFYKSTESFSISGQMNSDDDALPPAIYNIPWLFIWGDRRIPVDKKLNIQIDNYETLQDYCNHIGITPITSVFFDWLLNNEQKFEVGIFVLILGIWRPEELIPENPSDAVGSARKVEIIPIIVEVVNEDSRAVIKRIEQVTLLEKLSDGLLRKVSRKNHLTNLPKTAIIGAGAIGSKIIDFLCREGINDLILVDYDQFQPHNIARHTLGEIYVWRKKVEGLKSHLSYFFNADVVPIPKAVQALSVQEESKIRKCNIIIDTSADKNVSEYICNNNKLPRCIKGFITMEGRLGILLVEGQKHKPRIDDIEACLYLLSVGNELISEWLCTENTSQNTIIGLSCSSVTFRIPDSLVSVHASNFMPKISKILSEEYVEGGFGIHSTTSEGQSLGWEWISVPEFRSWKEKDNKDHTWDIRIHPEVIKTIGQVASNSIPNETGGFLYGLFNVNQRIVTIIQTCCPIPLKATPSGLVLPAAGNTLEEVELIEASNGNILALGSWHSHPSSSTNMSLVDINTMKEASIANNQASRPFVMLIYNNNEISINIAIPTDWF
jgi:hypothetical protein